MIDMSGWDTVAAHAAAVGANPDDIIRAAQLAGLTPAEIVDSYLRAELVSAWYLEHLTPLPFNRFDGRPPGAPDFRVFDQEEIWLDPLGRPHRIADRSDLTDASLRQAIAELEADAVELQNRYCTAFPARTVPSDPFRWLQSRPLYVALTGEIAKRSS